jgi:hypothetical protein
MVTHHPGHPVADSQKAGIHDRNRPLTWCYLVEMRGFEPLTPSMRTKCATGLRYIPEDSARLANLGGCSRTQEDQSPTARS